MKQNRKISIYTRIDDQINIIQLLIILFISSVQGQTFEPPNYSCSNNNFYVKFTLSELSHSGWESTSNCSLPKCNFNSDDNTNCRSSLTPCYEYRSSTGTSYCAPGILCEILESCNTINYNCSTNTSVCVINSCCSPQAICLPLLFANFCMTDNKTSYSKETTTTYIPSNQVTTPINVLSPDPSTLTDIKGTSENIQTTYFSGRTETRETSVKVTSQNPLTTSKLLISTHPNRCEEMQAVDDMVSKMITVTPDDIPKEEKINFEPTSTQGVSFPENNTRPTIIVDFSEPAEVQSLTIPRDKTPNANVQQFQVIFYSTNGNKINEKPILSNLSPKDNKTIPAQLNSTEIPSNTFVTWIEITIVRTTDDTSPKGLILDIKACKTLIMTD